MSSAYRSGEFLYQDCLWDDNGGGPAYRWWYYTAISRYEYPTNPAYRNNAADLVEVRLKPLEDATAIRVTYNTMTDPNLAAVTIALGGDPAQPVDVPHGANTKMPAQVFVTAHGSEGDIVDAATGAVRPERPTVTADVKRRQVEIRVPYSAFDPRGNTAVRVAAAAGLWDAAGQRYLVPIEGDSTATQPGGGGDGPSAFFNAAFRYDEPYDAAWRDHLQLAAIAKGDISPFFATVDFTKLAAGVNDDMNGRRGGVPTTGFMSMLFASHFETNQGRRIESDPNGPRPLSFSQQNGMSPGSPGKNQRPGLAFGWPCRDDCTPDLAGRLQRYLVYVPKVAPPPTGTPRCYGSADTPSTPVTSSTASATCTAQSATGPRTRRWWWGPTPEAPTSGPTGRAAPATSRRGPTSPAASSSTRARRLSADSPAAPTAPTSCR